MTPRPVRPPRTGDERRRARRVTIVGGLPGRVGDEAAPLSVREISLGGMAIETAFPFAVGNVCDFRLEMGDGAELELRGRALHSRRSGTRAGSPQYLTGFEFIDMDDDRSGDVDDLMERGRKA